MESKLKPCSNGSFYSSSKLLCYPCADICSQFKVWTDSERSSCSQYCSTTAQMTTSTSQLIYQSLAPGWIIFISIAVPFGFAILICLVLWCIYEPFRESIRGKWREIRSVCKRRNSNTSIPTCSPLTTNGPYSPVLPNGSMAPATTGDGNTSQPDNTRSPPASNTNNINNQDRENISQNRRLINGNVRFTNNHNDEDLSQTEVLLDANEIIEEVSRAVTPTEYGNISQPANENIEEVSRAVTPSEYGNISQPDNQDGTIIESDGDCSINQFTPENIVAAKKESNPEDNQDVITTENDGDGSIYQCTPESNENNEEVSRAITPTEYGNTSYPDIVAQMEHSRTEITAEAESSANVNNTFKE